MPEKVIDPKLSSLFEEFLKVYKPAANFSESTEHLNTEQIVERLESNYPFSDLHLESVYLMLTDNKFKFAPVGDGFVWLLAKK